MYFMVTQNHRQVSRAHLVLDIVSGGTTLATGIKIVAAMRQKKYI
jgi:hypothetical protein